MTGNIVPALPQLPKMKDIEYTDAVSGTILKKSGNRVEIRASWLGDKWEKIKRKLPIRSNPTRPAITTPAVQVTANLPHSERTPTRTERPTELEYDPKASYSLGVLFAVKDRIEEAIKNSFTGIDIESLNEDEIEAFIKSGRITDNDIQLILTTYGNWQNIAGVLSALIVSERLNKSQLKKISQDLMTERLANIPSVGDQREIALQLLETEQLEPGEQNHLVSFMASKMFVNEDYTTDTLLNDHFQRLYKINKSTASQTLEEFVSSLQSKEHAETWLKIVGSIFKLASSTVGIPKAAEWLTENKDWFNFMLANFKNDSDSYFRIAKLAAEYDLSAANNFIMKPLYDALTAEECAGLADTQIFEGALTPIDYAKTLLYGETNKMKAKQILNGIVEGITVESKEGDQLVLQFSNRSKIRALGALGNYHKLKITLRDTRDIEVAIETANALRQYGTVRMYKKRLVEKIKYSKTSLEQKLQDLDILMRFDKKLALKIGLLAVKRKLDIAYLFDRTIDDLAQYGREINDDIDQFAIQIAEAVLLSRDASGGYNYFHEQKDGSVRFLSESPEDLRLAAIFLKYNFQEMKKKGNEEKAKEKRELLLRLRTNQGSPFHPYSIGGLLNERDKIKIYRYFGGDTFEMKLGHLINPLRYSNMTVENFVPAAEAWLEITSERQFEQYTIKRNAVKKIAERKRGPVHEKPTVEEWALAFKILNKINHRDAFRAVKEYDEADFLGTNAETLPTYLRTIAEFDFIRFSPRKNKKVPMPNELLRTIRIIESHLGSNSIEVRIAAAEALEKLLPQLSRSSGNGSLGFPTEDGEAGRLSCTSSETTDPSVIDE